MNMMREEGERWRSWEYSSFFLVQNDRTDQVEICMIRAMRATSHLTDGRDILDIYSYHRRGILHSLTHSPTCPLSSSKERTFRCQSKWSNAWAEHSMKASMMILIFFVGLAALDNSSNETFSSYSISIDRLMRIKSFLLIFMASILAIGTCIIVRRQILLDRRTKETSWPQLRFCFLSSQSS